MYNNLQILQKKQVFWVEKHRNLHHYQLSIIKNAFKLNKNQVYLCYLRRSFLHEVNYFVTLQKLITEKWKQ